MGNSLRRALPYLILIAGAVVIGAFCRLPSWILTIATVVLSVAVIAAIEAKDRHDNREGGS